MVMDMREVMRRLPENGEIRHALRQFNLAPRADGKAKSVRKLAEDMGFDVVELDLPKGMNGRLRQEPFAKIGFRIEINSRLSVQAKRFAVLHELGHYFLHNTGDLLDNEFNFDLSGSTFYVDQFEEREANAFASAILFGNNSLRSAYSFHGGNVDKLCRYYGVTRQVIEIAIRDFRIA